MKKRLFALYICALLLAVAALPIAASANSAMPDPILTVKVKNAPDGEYYLDLLIHERPWNSTPDDYYEYDPGLLEGLFSLNTEEWWPSVAWSSHGYWQGDLAGTPSGGMMVHAFSVYSLPREFRIAVSSASGLQATEQIFHRDAYYTTIVYDYAANRIAYATPVWLAYLIQFLCTCIPTLLIEGVILLLFRFDWRKNRKVFLLLNLVTQAFLTWSMAGQYIGSGDRGYPFFMMILAEVPIFIAEAVVCAMKLKGHTRGRRVSYALCANAVSLTFGLWANPYIFRLLQQL